jgi:hypothetical protein
MPSRSFIRFSHRADILSKTFVTNDTGQRQAQWSTTSESAPCFATPAGMRASIRITPTAEQSSWISFFLPLNVEISFDSRVKDIRYKNEIIYPGLYEVHQIDPAPSFSGKPMYYTITLKSVIE